MEDQRKNDKANQKDLMRLYSDDCKGSLTPEAFKGQKHRLETEGEVSRGSALSRTY